MDICNDATRPLTEFLLGNYGVLDIVFREYDGAIHPEEKCGSTLCQAGAPESPRRGHLIPICFDCQELWDSN
jgi:hypothetical protein